MHAKLKKAALALAFAATLGLGSTLVVAPQPAEAGCLPICDSSVYCPPGYVGATECGTEVCRTFCAY